MLTERDLLRYAQAREQNLRSLRRHAAAYVAIYDKVEQEKAIPEHIVDGALQDMLEDKRDRLVRTSQYEQENIRSTLEKANRRKR